MNANCFMLLRIEKLPREKLKRMRRRFARILRVSLFNNNLQTTVTFVEIARNMTKNELLSARMEMKALF